MRIPERFFLNAYSAAIRLYPDTFRWRYHAQMLDAVHHTYLEQKTLREDLSLAFALVGDTACGVVREHARRTGPLRSGYLLAFALLFSALQVVAAISYERYLQMAVGCHPSMRVNKMVAEAAAQPANITLSLGGMHTEIATPDWLAGGDSFAAMYNAHGEPLASDATLHGVMPHPPQGIFSAMRTNALSRETWQPEAGIRMFLVGQRLPDGSFVLAGRSLLDADAREARFQNGMAALWILMAATIFTLMLRPRPRRPISPPHKDANTA